MRSIILISFLIAMVAKANAQDTLPAQPNNTTGKAKHFSIKTNPFQFPITGEVRLLTEKFLNEKNSVELITGYFTNFPYYSVISIYPNKQIGFKIGTGYRHYFNSRFYINPLFFYKYMYYENADLKTYNSFSGYHTWNEYEASMRFTFATNIYSFQLQMGCVLGKIFQTDIYWGFGIRLRQAKLFKFTYYNRYQTSNYNEFAPYIFPTLHFGINFGYKK